MMFVVTNTEKNRMRILRIIPDNIFLSQSRLYCGISV